MLQAKGWRASGAAGGFRSEVKGVGDRVRCGSAENAFGVDIAALEPDPSKLLLSPGGPESVYIAGTAFPGLAFLPWTTIGIRASAVAMMVELRELVVLTAVAGHRLPHCWRDGCEQERDCSI